MPTLVRLAPDPDSPDSLRLAAATADILNHDDGLPPGMKVPAGQPPETALHVLAFTRDWCLARAARYHAVVDDAGRVIGGATLSRIDVEAGTARIGWFLASGYQDRQTATVAALFGLARKLGLRQVATTAADGDQALWQDAGIVADIIGKDLVGRL